MKNLLLPFYLFLLLTGLYAQAQHLEIKKLSNGKVRTIKIKQSFSFKLSESDDYKKGKIQSFTDSSLVIFTPEEDDIQLREVKLKDIYAIKKLSGLHKAGYATGAVLIVGGASALLVPSTLAGDDGSDWLARGIGAAGVLVGLIPYLIKPTEFIQGQNAEFTVVK